MPRKIFGSGLYGRKDNGRWGRLNGREIFEKLISGEISEKTAKDRMTEAQQKNLEKYYRKVARDTNKRIDLLKDFLSEHEGMESSALDSIGGEKIPKQAPKDLDELIDYGTMAYDFLAEPTSLPEGVADFYKEFSDSSDGYIEDDFYEEASDTTDTAHDSGTWWDRQREFEEWFNENKERETLKWKYVDRILKACPEIRNDPHGVSDVEAAVEYAMYQGFDMEKFCLEFIQNYQERKQKGSDWHRKNQYSF